MPTIDLRSILQETVSGWYGDLVTRPTGHAVRRGVEEVLAECDGEQVAVIDFSSVRLLDLSCADEVVAKLLLQHGRTRPFLLRGISEDHQEALEPVLRGHGLAAVARDRMGRVHFLGVITERVRVALIMLAERGSAEVEEVADHLAVPTSAAREVLDELLERRLALTNAAGNQVISIA
jgi:hypothetical protein